MLFLARLHPRKRPTMFVRMAAALVEAGIDAHFSLVGPDEGEGAAVAKLIEQSSLQSRVSYEGPLKPAQSISRMRRAKVYVLPSVDEPYPMSVLEAMSVGLSRGGHRHLRAGPARHGIPMRHRRRVR